MKTIITYIIIGIVLACYKDEFGFCSDNFWIRLLTSALIIILWFPVLIIGIIVEIITMLISKINQDNQTI